MEKRTLLIPVENLHGQHNFILLGTSDQVDIIAFKTCEKENFVSMLHDNLNDLRQLAETESIRQKISFVEETLKDANTQKWQKSPEQRLLDAAMNQARQAGMYMTYPLTRENTIYTVRTA